jgi:hypothetical protein
VYKDYLHASNRTKKNEETHNYILAKITNIWLCMASIAKKTTSKTVREDSWKIQRFLSFYTFHKTSMTPKSLRCGTSSDSVCLFHQSSRGEKSGAANCWHDTVSKYEWKDWMMFQKKIFWGRQSCRLRSLQTDNLHWICTIEQYFFHLKRWFWFRSYKQFGH